MVLHYAPVDIIARIRSAAEGIGRSLDSLTRDEMSSFDEFHVGGREHTRRLAAEASLARGELLLDVGCGVGGPARTLAAEFGARVTAIDITEHFVYAAKELNRVAGLQHVIDCWHADASSLPFRDESFDVVWIQHVAANVGNKVRLFAECRRVLRTGGRLAIHEVVRGSVDPIFLPVFWAESPEHNHLLSAKRIREIITRSGFDLLFHSNVTEDAITFFRRARERSNPEQPRISPAVIIPVEPGRKSLNMLRNLQEQRIEVIRAVYTAA